MGESYSSGQTLANLSGTSVQAGNARLATTQTAVFARYKQNPSVANTHYTIFTPTNGKTAYIKTLKITALGSSTIRCGDNISGNATPADGAGTDILINGVADVTDTTVFPVPMVVSTALKIVCSNTTGFYVTAVGWEETT